jgi:steroid delta-isomerase
MYSDFSFGKLLRHLDGIETVNRPTGSPTEAHMRTVMEGYVACLGATNADAFAVFTEKYLALPRHGEDPVGTKPIVFTGIGEESLADLAQLIDVPFIPVKAELTAPPTFSLTNKGAFSFRLWAEVDGRSLTIDIIEVMTFNDEGKVTEQFAYWGVDNVTLLD